MTQFRELIHLGLQRYQPNIALRPWIECYWVVANGTCRSSMEYLYRDGGSSLIFDLTGRDFYPATFTAHQAPQVFAITGPLFGVRFRAAGAHRLLGLPMGELGGSCLSEAHLVVPNLLELCEQMTAKSIPAQVMSVDQWMLAQARRHSCSQTLGERLPAQVASQSGSIKGLLLGLGVSRRTAERQVKEQTGCTLRQLLAWSRVKRARHLIKLDEGATLTEIGLMCGYYDQSHFVREFRKTTSFSPTEYRNRQRNRIRAGEMEISAQGRQSIRLRSRPFDGLVGPRP